MSDKQSVKSYPPGKGPSLYRAKLQHIKK